MEIIVIDVLLLLLLLICNSQMNNVDKNSLRGDRCKVGNTQLNRYTPNLNKNLLYYIRKVALIFGC